jgi:hypothetical protein
MESERDGEQLQITITASKINELLQRIHATLSFPSLHCSTGTLLTWENRLLAVQLESVSVWLLHWTQTAFDCSSLSKNLESTKYRYSKSAGLLLDHTSSL